MMYEELQEMRNKGLETMQKGDCVYNFYEIEDLAFNEDGEEIKINAYSIEKIYKKYASSFDFIQEIETYSMSGDLRCSEKYGLNSNLERVRTYYIN